MSPARTARTSSAATPETWLREVIRARPDQFRLDQVETPENALPY